jgi:hypothetical protein
MFAACALKPPMLPAMALPIMFLAMLTSIRACTEVFSVQQTTLAGMIASQTTYFPLPSILKKIVKKLKLNCITGEILPVDCSWLFISAEVARQTQNLHFGERSLNNFQRKFSALKHRIKCSKNKFNRRLNYLGEHVHAHGIPSGCYKSDEQVPTSYPDLQPFKSSKSACRIKAFLELLVIVQLLHPVHCFTVKTQNFEKHS